MTAQSMEALAVAKQVKTARCDLKQEIREGRISVSEVLTEEIPEWLERMPISKLLNAPYRFPKKLLAQFLADCPIGELQEVGWATTRQREWLAGAMLSWEARRDASRERAERLKVAA